MDPYTKATVKAKIINTEKSYLSSDDMSIIMIEIVTIHEVEKRIYEKASIYTLLDDPS